MLGRFHLFTTASFAYAKRVSGIFMVLGMQPASVLANPKLQTETCYNIIATRNCSS